MLLQVQSFNLIFYAVYVCVHNAHRVRWYAALILMISEKLSLHSETNKQSTTTATNYMLFSDRRDYSFYAIYRNFAS